MMKTRGHPPAQGVRLARRFQGVCLSDPRWGVGIRGERFGERTSRPGPPPAPPVHVPAGNCLLASQFPDALTQEPLCARHTEDVCLPPAIVSILSCRHDFYMIAPPRGTTILSCRHDFYMIALPRGTTTAGLIINNHTFAMNSELILQSGR